MKSSNTIFLSVFTLATSLSVSAQAAFECGPGFKTYAVTAGSGGGTPQGVRCVKFNNYQVINGEVVGAYWYGEGQWNGRTYRHIGFSYKSMRLGSGYDTKGRAADIYGNGENAGGSADNLHLKAVDGWKKIRVTGNWNETWTYQSSGKVYAYTSGLAPVKRCGPHFTTFKVSDASGSTTGGSGIRCAIRDPYIALPSIWYGEGNWRSNKYMHLGFVRDLNAGAWNLGYGTGTDICDKANYFCGSTAVDAIEIDVLTGCGEPIKYQLSGAWNEQWSSSDRLKCIH